MAKKSPQTDNIGSGEDKEKTSIYIRTELLKSIKYIAFTDEKTRTDIIDEALTDYLAKWEKKNGSVPKKGQ